MKILFTVIAFLVTGAAWAGCESEVNKIYALMPYSPGSSFLSSPTGFEGFSIGKKSQNDSVTVSIPFSAGSCAAKLDGLEWVEDTRFSANAGANKGVLFVPARLGAAFNPKTYNMYVMRAAALPQLAPGSQFSAFTLVGNGAGGASPCTELQGGLVKTYWKVCTLLEAAHL